MNSSLLVFLFLCLVMAVLSNQQQNSPFYYKRDKFGQYAFQYQTADGTLVREQGALKGVPRTRGYVLVKRGSYRFRSSDGVPVEVRYFADEHGYHPYSENIPKPIV